MGISMGISMGMDGVGGEGGIQKYTGITYSTKYHNNRRIQQTAHMPSIFNMLDYLSVKGTNLGRGGGGDDPAHMAYTSTDWLDCSNSSDMHDLG